MSDLDSSVRAGILIALLVSLLDVLHAVWVSGADPYMRQQAQRLIEERSPRPPVHCEDVVMFEGETTLVFYTPPDPFEPCEN